MKRAFLIYNPASGRKRGRQAGQVARATAVFRAAGIETESCATTGAGSAIRQTQEAVVQGFDTILACGGDGTAHEVLNGLMLLGPALPVNVALGVIPLGSGNVLATDLGLPRDVEAAARLLLRYQPRELHPGVISYQTKAAMHKRWLLVAAGVGADAQLMYRTAVSGAKNRWGIYAYFLEMARMAWQRRFPTFHVEWRNESSDQSKENAEVSLALALRAGRFPGLLRRVRLGSGLARNNYRLLLFKTGKVMPFLRAFASLASGRNWSVSHVELVHSTWFHCTPLDSCHPSVIHCEADGELLGALPVEVSIEPRTFRLLMP